MRPTAIPAQPTDHVSCQTYQWGFSFLQLFVGLILMLTWTIGVCVIWLRGHVGRKSRPGDEVPTRYKAVLNLASSLCEAFSAIGEEPDALTNSQLKQHIAKSLDGGRVEAVNPFPAKYKLRAAAWAWFKRDKWWILLLGISTGGGFLFPGALVFPSGVLLAIAIGKSNGSRAVMALGSGLMAIPVMVVFGLKVYS
jgi:hypothetical protein